MGLFRYSKSAYVYRPTADMKIVTGYTQTGISRKHILYIYSELVGMEVIGLTGYTVQCTGCFKNGFTKFEG